MRIVVLTSCTGEKTPRHDLQLRAEDFRRGPVHVRRREQELAVLLTPAEELYAGQQHVRLIRGVCAVRAVIAAGAPLHLALHILSAGYGLVPGSRSLAPYECTFQGMPRKDARRWAARLGVPADVRTLLAQPADLMLVLLGDDYLDACALGGDVTLGGPTLLFCGPATARRLPDLPGLRPVVLTDEDTRRFSAGQVGLKGEVAARVLERLAADAGFAARLADPATDILALLDDGVRIPRRGRLSARAQPDVDRVIDVPPAWREASARRPLGGETVCASSKNVELAPATCDAE